MQKMQRRKDAFTLIETMSVLCIMALLVGIAIPAVRGISESNRLSSASRMVSNLLSVARTEAVTKRTMTRFVVVNSWESHPEAQGRRVSVWMKDVSNGSWAQVTKWEDMPTGVSFDSDAAAYAGDSDANHFLARDGTNIFPATINGQSVELRYLEFQPTGAASSIASMTGTDIWMALCSRRDGNSSQETTANWAKITASTLTGRLKIDRP